MNREPANHALRALEWHGLPRFTEKKKKKQQKDHHHFLIVNREPANHVPRALERHGLPRFTLHGSRSIWARRREEEEEEEEEEEVERIRDKKRDRHTFSPP